MALSLKHAFNSPKADGVDTTLVQPSNWNAEHTVVMAAGKVLGTLVGATAASELAIEVDATNQSVILPKGTTAQRPAAPVAGMSRLNTDLSRLETYTAAGWRILGNVYVSATAPASPGLGEAWYETDTALLQIWDGTVWQPAVVAVIADGAVTTIKIAANAVTPAKLALGVWTNLASAGTTDLGAQASRNLVITGTTTITSFGTTATSDNVPFSLRFATTLTLTNGANLILPGAADIVTEAGDVAIAVWEGANVWRVIDYQRAAAPANVRKVGTAATNVVALDGSAKLPAVDGSQLIQLNDFDYAVECRRTSGTADGASTSATWQNRILNTVVKTAAWASLSTSIVTLQAGTYDIEWDCPLYNSGRGQSQLYNDTDAAMVGMGSSERSNVASGYRSIGRATVTIATAKGFRLRTYCGNSDGSGLGEWVGTGDSEVYSRMRVKRVV